MNRYLYCFFEPSSDLMCNIIPQGRYSRTYLMFIQPLEIWATSELIPMLKNWYLNWFSTFHATYIQIGSLLYY